jgi:hypothetical protein
MKAAIMQPYFLPYLGYFQLIAAVDCFVIYDTIQYTKKGWINRNKMLRNGEAVPFTLPIQKASDYLDVRDRQLAESFDPANLRAQIAGAYRKAPEFARTFPMIEGLLHYRGANLFDVIHNALLRCCDHLGIETPIRVSSEVEGGAPVLRGVDRVIDICHRTGASTYVNPPGGRALYSGEQFRAHGLGLKFLQPNLPIYPQFGSNFVPSLSILDVMMFNTPQTIRCKMLEAAELVD